MSYYICIGNRHGRKLYGEVGRTARTWDTAIKYGLQMARYFHPAAAICGEPKTIAFKGVERRIYDFGHPCFRLVIQLP